MTSEKPLFPNSAASQKDAAALAKSRKSASTLANLDLIADGKHEFPEDWSRIRISVAQFISAKSFDVIMTVLILINIVCTAREADVDVRCSDPQEGTCQTDIFVLMLLNNIILVFYGLECLSKMFILRGTWHLSAWNLFDFAIVLSGLASEAFAGMIPRTSVVRVLRLARLAKLVKFLIGFRELYLILSGFLSVGKTILWAAILLFIALTICSVIAVEYIHPINNKLDHGTCTWCANAFETVMKSNVTLFQMVILGDMWGFFTQPLIDDSPVLAFFLVVVVLVFVLGFANLIMAVIVEKAFESRSEDERYQLILQEQEVKTLKTKFQMMCKELDDDGDGTLSKDELFHNYDNNRTFATTLRSMKIDKDELGMVFQMLDSDGSGSVSYEEFADNLYKMKSAHQTTMLLFILFHVKTMDQQIERLHQDVRKVLPTLPVPPEDPTCYMEHAPPQSPNVLPPLPVPQFDSKAIEDQFFELRDRVQARLSAVTCGSVRHIEDEVRALTESTQALASLDKAMPRWAGQVAQLRVGLPEQAQAAVSAPSRWALPCKVDVTTPGEMFTNLVAGPSGTTDSMHDTIIVDKEQPNGSNGCSRCQGPQ